MSDTTCPHCGAEKDAQPWPVHDHRWPERKPMSRHETFQTAHPTCPHCGYELDDDDMQSKFSEADLLGGER